MGVVQKRKETMSSMLFAKKNESGIHLLQDDLDTC